MVKTGFVIGVLFAQFAFVCAEFHDDNAPEVSPFGPSPSEWPTCPCVVVESDVQSPHVSPGNSVPSAPDPVMMSCSTGDGDPGHWPLIGWPFSSTNTVESPLRAWSSVRLLATMTPFALNQGPLPIRLRASVDRLPLSASRSTLR